MSKHKTTNKGFTLIELVIVLAIAALVLAAILLAVSGAQRSQRDITTKNSAGRLASAIQNYASNNSGTAPTAALNASYTSGIVDGKGNGPAYSNTDITSATAGTNEIIYAGATVCASGSSIGAAGSGNTRNYAVEYWVENGATTVCTDNK